MSETRKLLIEKIPSYVVAVLVVFSTYMLQDIWQDWKQHLREDKATELTVQRHEDLLTEHGKQINFLTGRIDVIGKYSSR